MKGYNDEQSFLSSYWFLLRKKVHAIFCWNWWKSSSLNYRHVGIRFSKQLQICAVHFELRPTRIVKQKRRIWELTSFEGRYENWTRSSVTFSRMTLKYLKRNQFCHLHNIREQRMPPRAYRCYDKHTARLVTVPWPSPKHAQLFPYLNL